MKNPFYEDNKSTKLIFTFISWKNLIINNIVLAFKRVFAILA